MGYQNGYGQGDSYGKNGSGYQNGYGQGDSYGRHDPYPNKYGKNGGGNKNKKGGILPWLGVVIALGVYLGYLS